MKNIPGVRILLKNLDQHFYIHGENPMRKQTGHTQKGMQNCLYIANAILEIIHDAIKRKGYTVTLLRHVLSLMAKMMSDGTAQSGQSCVRVRILYGDPSLQGTQD